MKNYIEQAIALAELNNWVPTENIVRALVIFIQKQEEECQKALADIVEKAK